MKNKNKHKKAIKETEKLNSNDFEIEKSNSLTELALGLRTQQNVVSQADTIDVNLRRYMLTTNRMLLSQMYIELGIVQTLIDQPVDDAYATLPKLKSPQISVDDSALVEQYIIENGWFEKFKQAIKWGRLFGGAGLYINTNQNPATKLTLETIKKESNIELYACDRLYI